MALGSKTRRKLQANTAGSFGQIRNHGSFDPTLIVIDSSVDEISDDENEVPWNKLAYYTFETLRQIYR